ncbi:MAG: hypothetical protein PHP99_01805 [Paludibacter sp.]|nr:hypothetical protein [Paludibacter sp.]
MENKHNQNIPEEVLTQVTTKLNEILTLVKPYAITLTPEERKSMLKMGDKSNSFVEKALEYTRTNPEFVPAYMNVAEFETDFVETKNLIGVMSLATQVSNSIDDTQLAAGSEAYHAALYYYGNVQQSAAVNVPGAKAIYDELKKRFPNTRKA